MIFGDDGASHNILRSFTCDAVKNVAIERLRDGWTLQSALFKDHPSPEARIPYLGASGTFLPVGLLMHGWTKEYTVLWFVPDIRLLFIGLGILAPLATIPHYIIDCYSSNGFAEPALAAMNVARFLAGFGPHPFADELYDTLGLDWGNSLLALIATVAGSLSVSL